MFELSAVQHLALWIVSVLHGVESCWQGYLYCRGCSSPSGRAGSSGGVMNTVCSLRWDSSSSIRRISSSLSRSTYSRKHTRLPNQHRLDFIIVCFYFLFVIVLYTEMAFNSNWYEEGFWREFKKKSLFDLPLTDPSWILKHFRILQMSKPSTSAAYVTLMFKTGSHAVFDCLQTEQQTAAKPCLELNHYPLFHCFTSIVLNGRIILLTTL